MAKTAPLTVDIEDEIRESLEQLATNTGREIAELVSEALTQYVTLQEWQVRAIDEAIAEADAGAPRIPHADVMAWIDSWDKPDELPPPG